MCSNKLLLVLLFSSYIIIDTGAMNQYFGSDIQRKSREMNENPSFSRLGRFLSIFTYVQFSNQECVGKDGQIGLCVGPQDCTRKGGISIGTCASGHGLCCSIAVKCGGIIRNNVSYFVNTGYPKFYNEVGSCQVTLLKANPSVCQYRLDFDEFNIRGPEELNHVCIYDQFIISGSKVQIPIICGINTGNHVIIDTSGEYEINPIILAVITSGELIERRWKIRVTQILCSSRAKAEPGCLQYFTGVAGQIRSFNFDLVNGRQLSNQDYTICVRAENNFCGIRYSQCIDDVNSRNYSFTLSGNSNQAVPSMVGSNGNSNSCSNDYVIIPMATNVNRFTQGSRSTVDRICGGIFSAGVSQTPSVVSSTVRPFVLVFHSDSTEAPVDRDNKGFCLDYVQQPCINRIR